MPNRNLARLQLEIGIGVNVANLLASSADKLLKPFINRQLGEVASDPHTQKWCVYRANQTTNYELRATNYEQRCPHLTLALFWNLFWAHDYPTIKA